MPAWDFAPTEREQAYATLLSTVRELQDDGAAELLEVDRDRGYVKARIRYELRGKHVDLASPALQAMPMSQSMMSHTQAVVLLQIAALWYMVTPMCVPE